MGKDLLGPSIVMDQALGNRGMRIDMERKKWTLLELGTVEYRDAWDLQSRLVEARKGRALDRDIVLFLEHPPVFTLGRRGGHGNLRVSESFLEERGIPVIHVERGGDITYHGPGQLVIYPIVDLKALGLDVSGYVTRLEEVMIRTVGDFGVMAERDPKNRGAWVGGNKIGSIGIAIRHGITFHGLALNINTGLAPFTWIHPCGLQEIEITSIERELGSGVSMEEAFRRAKYNMEEVFGVELVRVDIQDMRSMVPDPAAKKAFD
ncbi:MAG: lipoyl(octanoyl) transferase LipB [Deltaproteobacteria bacterium]|nr:lipoyl(octanoyl) transferase LipB [Deltaproteobacteria bacterium]